MDGSNGPFLLPGSLIQNNVKPSQADVTRYKALMQQRSGQIGKVLRLQRFGVSNVSMISLKQSFQGWDVGRKIPLTQGAQSELHQRVPSALGFISVAAGDDLPVIVGMHPSMHWEGMQNTFGSGIRLSVDFEMLSAEIVAIGGRRCLLLVLNPISIGLDGSERAPILTALSAPPTNTGYKFDVLGAKLGMDLDEAVSKIKSAFSEYQTASAELEGKSADPLFRFVQIDVGKDGTIVERLFVGTKIGSNTVIFIKRGWKSAGGSSTPEEDQGMFTNCHGQSVASTNRSTGTRTVK